MTQDEYIYLTIPEKHYVGVKDSDLDTTKFPLAFMTPLEKNAAFEKRKKSVHSWCDGYYSKEKNKSTFHEIDNIPREGFKIVGYNSRYSTSNKHVEVTHPLGFSFEITIQNVFDLLTSSSCQFVDGVLQGKYMFGRNGPQNILISENHPTIKKFLKPETKISDLIVGDVIVVNKNRYVYLGKKLVCADFSWYHTSTVYVPQSFSENWYHSDADIDFAIFGEKELENIFGDAYTKNNFYRHYGLYSSTVIYKNNTAKDYLHSQKNHTVYTSLVKTVDLSENLADIFVSYEDLEKEEISHLSYFIGDKLKIQTKEDFSVDVSNIKLDNVERIYPVAGNSKKLYAEKELFSKLFAKSNNNQIGTGYVNSNKIYLFNSIEEKQSFISSDMSKERQDFKIHYRREDNYGYIVVKNSDIPVNYARKLQEKFGYLLDETV